MNEACGNAVNLAAALNEIDELSGTKFNDLEIFDYIGDHAARFGVDLEAFNAVELLCSALECNQYRYIIPIGSVDDRAVVLWNRVTNSWEALSNSLMPSFVTAALMPENTVMRV